MAVALSPDPLVETLLRLAALLHPVEPRWSKSMSRMARRASGADGPERRAVISDVLSIYGGTGSFNDVVLQDAAGARPEQAELGELRSRLFDVARAELS